MVTNPLQPMTGAYNSLTRVNPNSIVQLEYSQHVLRTSLPFIAIASLVFVAGAASIFLSRLRSRDRLLLWLGIFALIYGLRLFLENDLVRTASGADPQSLQFWVLFLTYLIAIPYALFAREYFGPGWKNSFTVWLWTEIAFAPLAIAAVLFVHMFYAAERTNNALIIAGTLLVSLHALHHRRAASIPLKFAMIAAGALVLLNNFRFRPAGINLEPIGFLTLLFAFGYTASQQAIGKERKLTEVEHELAMARSIQNSILPQSLPDVPALQIATRYQPMTAVAGDFYDFLKTREDLLTILVADVSGHGVPAALVASMLKICFAAQRENAADPAKILAAFNSMLRDALGGQYVTAACAAINLPAKIVTYAGAGHPPALLLQTNSSRVMQLAENGLFIGPFPQATYSSISAPFESGDKLLLYTDGIIETTMPDGEQFGNQGLTNFLLSSRGVQPSDFVNRLFEKISTVAQEDDRTAVLVQFEASK
jgi:sigma-B regulation protein RsbU (phosphoserine phosphatase)